MRFVASIAVIAALPAVAAADPDDGTAVYATYCLACHGAAGDGAGPAAPLLWPKPRDFTAGVYKWRSTAGAGDGPTVDDLATTVRDGAPGTAMPGFGGILTEPQIAAVVATVVGFAPAAKIAKTGTAAPAPPAASEDAVGRGKAAFSALGCVSCHGDSARGDGPATKWLKPGPPYDLTAIPLRRPRGDGADDTRTALWLSIRYGVGGTAMPSHPAPSDDDVWDVVDFVDSIRYRGPIAVGIPDAAKAADVAPPVTWVGTGAPDEAAIWGGPIALQGEPPASLAPAEASLSSRQCARCHAKQAREWTGSLHGHAVSPGLLAQITKRSPDAPAWADVEACQRCHAPLAEQLPVLRGTDDANAAYDEALRGEGITCAGCHVRGWTRNGPPRVAATLIPVDTYPLNTLGLYERSDFCQPCHELPARTAVNGKPLLDTYREWLNGPYMKRGVQCQHCHMPNREHTWKGVHDPDTFRQGIEVTASSVANSDGLLATARLRNIGAGHYLPTTPTPAAWLRIELLDAKGRAIAGTLRTQRIGRKIQYGAKGWTEVEDTRVPPGESIELTASLPAANAVELEVTVEVHPDDYYERFYASHLAGTLDDDIRALYETAAARATASHYEAYRARFPITH